MKVYIVVDMQNDFITGSLANPAATAIVKPICSYLRKNVKSKDLVIFTADTHNNENYLNTQEGRKLPVPHCIENTPGWNICDDLLKVTSKLMHDPSVKVVKHPKYQFGDAKNIAEDIMDHLLHLHFTGDTFQLDEIVLVGTCTDICVVSNALGLKAEFPEVPIKVIGKLCAGLTEEKHEAALEVMRSCQVEVE